MTLDIITLAKIIKVILIIISHKIAISNSRILSVTETEATFSARSKKLGEQGRSITLCHEDFIRRFLMHMLPAGFQKIRYYDFLNKRMESKNLKVIFRLQRGQRFKQRYAGLTMAECYKLSGILISVSALIAGMTIPIYILANRPRAFQII